MLMLFASAFVLGLVFNAAPGGVCRNRAPRCARRLSPCAGGAAGLLVGDASWALLGLAGIGLVMQVDALRWPIGLAGAAYLLWLSWDSWQAARTEHRLDASATAAATQKQALRRGMALSLTNPQNLAYWAAMGSALGAVGVTQPGASDYGLFFAGFMTSSLLWCFVCAALVDRLFRRAAAHWSRFTYRCCRTAAGPGTGHIARPARHKPRRPATGSPAAVPALNT
jgi:chemosensory pili system protein ChpE/L-lysine exporter family protein LysE/ArgO